MLVKMVQQMSGTRPDGRPWPQVGGLIEVSDAEGQALCHSARQQSHPIAEEVAQEGSAPERETREETGDADQRSVETSAPKATRQARPEPRPARPAAEKRG